jgi:hypothetical protein
MTQSSITPEQLKQAEERWKRLRDAGDDAAADAENDFQQLAQSYTVGLQRQHEQQMISRMLK